MLSNGDFLSYLSRVCVRGRASFATISSHVHSVWNDLLVTNSAAQVANCAKF